MKLIIAGSRTLQPTPEFIMSAINMFDIKFITEVVSGGANGVDLQGEFWANAQKLSIKQFFPDWNVEGKAAGPIRNRKMAEYADALLLIWDGASPGSRSMRQQMRALNKPIYEMILVAD